MSNLQSSFSLKIIQDLVRAIKQDSSLTYFEIIPTLESENKNSSPVLRGESTLGFESWAIRHVLPYAHRQIVGNTLKKDAVTLASCILTINLLHPEMPTAWSRRRELILQRKMPPRDDLRITRLVLSRVPKCNEALAHRRWLICNKFLSGNAGSILDEELDLADVVAARYPSNYHAWSHRQWCLQHLAPPSCRDRLPSKSAVAEFSKRDMCYVFAASTLPIYLNELEANFQFVSTHVSDHSGLHFRTFLLSQIFGILDTAGDCKKTNNVDCCRRNKPLLFYNFLKDNITEFLTGSNDVFLEEYLSNLRNKLSLFDVIISFILAELKSNASLCETFVGHEALWCYRKFLVFSFHSTLSKVCSLRSQSDVAKLIYARFSASEKLLITLQGQRREEDYDPRVVANYCDWLKRVTKLDVNSESMPTNSSSINDER